MIVAGLVIGLSPVWLMYVQAFVPLDVSWGLMAGLALAWLLGWLATRSNRRVAGDQSDEGGAAR